MREKVKEVIKYYVKLKGLDLSDLTSRDWARFTKRIKELFERTENIDTIKDCMLWVSQQEYFDWTLETVDKKWLDWKSKSKKLVPKEHILADEFNQKWEQWQREANHG